jgi:hypothetical protein
VIAFASHLHDDRLFDCYLAARAGEALDPPAAEHLVDCAACAARFDELSRFMDEVRAVGDADLDAHFPPERLRAQQQHIARRLETVGRSARVIHFPSPLTAHRIPATAKLMLPRWVAAAAAAGLVAGVSVGFFYDRDRVSTTMARAGLHTPRPSLSAVRPAPPADSRDDVFYSKLFSEIEAAADRPRTEELAAYDALTPHIREVSLSVLIH